MQEYQRIRVIDSHTGGEPTRCVVSGGPDLGAGPLAERLERFRSTHDHFRSASVNEPRGSDVMVGALLCDPVDSACAAGVIFFNNVGYLGMCGHGTIGLVATLAYMKRIAPGRAQDRNAGRHRERCLARRTARSQSTTSQVIAARPTSRSNVPGYGEVRGDVAWGGNWFFLVHDHAMELTLQNVDQ